MKTFTILLMGLSVITVSCKKDRTCNCTVVTTGTTNTKTSSLLLGIDTTISVPLNTTNVNTITFQGVNKKMAKYNCFDRSEAVNESTNNGIPGVVEVTVSNIGTRVYSCELE